MSTHIVEVVPFTLEPLPNSDFLSLAHVRGWQCIVRTTDFENVDRGVYIPIDSIVPDEERFAFLDRPSKGVTDEEHASSLAAEGAKFVRKKYRRVKTIRLRGAISQGILLPLTEFAGANWALGTNVADKLGITKYEPPQTKSTFKAFGSPGSPFLAEDGGLFHRYTCIENIKNYPDVLTEGEEVVFSEKLHGSNARIAVIKDASAPSGWRFEVGSHRKRHLPSIQEEKFIEPRSTLLKILTRVFPFLKAKQKVTWTNPFIYWKIVNKFGFEGLMSNFVHLATAYDAEAIIVFGEVYGPGVQDLTYGRKDLGLRVFDISINGRYLDWDAMVQCVGILGLETVPVLGRGAFSKETLLALTDGKSSIAPDQIREGCVVRPLKERWDARLGRVILKSVSDAYLLRKGGTENH